LAVHLQIYPFHHFGQNSHLGAVVQPLTLSLPMSLAPKSHFCNLAGKLVIGLSDLMSLLLTWGVYIANRRKLKSIQCSQKHTNLMANGFRRSKDIQNSFD
jgi:hypothetical protein